MQLKITVSDNEGDLTTLREELRGVRGVGAVQLEKSNPETLSIYDTLSVLVQTPEAAVAIAAGIGALFAAFGNRAKVTVHKDGSVIADRVSSKDAAKIVAKAVEAKAAAASAEPVK